MDLEHEYKKSTRWLTPLFLTALAVLLAFVLWRAMTEDSSPSDEQSVVANSLASVSRA